MSRGPSVPSSVTMGLFSTLVIGMVGLADGITQSAKQGKRAMQSLKVSLGGYAASCCVTDGHGPLPHGRREDQTPQAWLDRSFGQLGLYQLARPLVVGLVQGLAGSAASALLVLATIRDPLWATVYLLVFAVGSIAGMMLITAAVALPFAYTASRFTQINRYLGTASALLSPGFSLFLVHQVRRRTVREPAPTGRRSDGRLDRVLTVLFGLRHNSPASRVILTVRRAPPSLKANERPDGAERGGPD